MPQTQSETFSLQSDSNELKPLREKLRGKMQAAGFTDKDSESMLVALCEAVTNCIRHSYQGQAGKEIQVTWEETQDKVTLKIRDFGQKIKLGEVKEPTLPPVKGGGLGVYFMKTIMDELEYNTAHTQGNELIMSKYKQGKKP